MGKYSDIDLHFMELAIKTALDAEENGNLPIGSLIILDERILSRGLNSVREPEFHPGRHAEIEALKGIPSHYWLQSEKKVCYTTLEPCVMCFGSLLLHGFYFGDKVLWIDKVPLLSQAEIWLEVITDDVENTSGYLIVRLATLNFG